jgi:hypothetical protein
MLGYVIDVQSRPTGKGVQVVQGVTMDVVFAKATGCRDCASRVHSPIRGGINMITKSGSPETSRQPLCTSIVISSMNYAIVPGYLFASKNLPICLNSLRLDQQAGTSHLVRLGQTHDGENGRGNITEDTIGLLEAVALGSVGHDEGDLVESVRGLGGVLLVEHLLCVAVVGGDEEGVAALLALLVDLADSLVGLGAGNDGSVIDTSVANHVGGSKVVHEELELALLDTFAQLVGDSHGAHLGLLVVGGDAGRGNHVSNLVVELDLDTTVEEEGDVGVLFRLSDVALVNLLLCEPLGEDVVHGLRSEGEGEGVVGLVAGHCGDVHVGGVGEVGLGAAVLVADKLGNLADTV